MTKPTVLKILDDKLTNEHIQLANDKLAKPGTLLHTDLGIPDKLALRIFLACAINDLGTVHLVCLPIDKSGELEAVIRPFKDGFPPEPEKYTYNTALKFEVPIRVGRMTKAEHEAIMDQRKRQNRSGSG